MTISVILRMAWNIVQLLKLFITFRLLLLLIYIWTLVWKRRRPKKPKTEHTHPCVIIGRYYKLSPNRTRRSPITTPKLLTYPPHYILYLPLIYALKGISPETVVVPCHIIVRGHSRSRNSESNSSSSSQRKNHSRKMYKCMEGAVGGRWRNEWTIICKKHTSPTETGGKGWSRLAWLAVLGTKESLSCLGVRIYGNTETKKGY